MKPPICHHEQPCLACATVECQNHYRQSLLDAADELEYVIGKDNGYLIKLVRKMRVSAGYKV